MAFNFNWSPLTADALFYERAKELLTNALNRNGPRPAIIVDDILVSELNLGDVPPELEIVEIGDLAEDRFRGTFKMQYQGDAVLSLKTRVQANPLNTYLMTRSSFASPQPLAAATGLTIPLQITLSDIRLSGFITLVFSRQKGLTIVFKDDPLESLRVSSTFDSIPFVANYLQKEIEGQLRILLRDELPAIIHRLSLQLWAPEQQARTERELGGPTTPKDEIIVDPLASPPQDPVDSSGNVLGPSEIAALSLDSSVETHSLFSQKNLIRLATLTDSHRTLSLFTPSIRDAVFRAWTGPLERGEMKGTLTRSATPALSRTHSYAGSLTSTTYTFDTMHSRPSMYSFPSSGHGLSMGGRKPHGTRKRKKRVVNLRKRTEEVDGELVSEDGSTLNDSASVSESTSTAASVFSAPPATTSSGAQLGIDITTPPMSPITRGSADRIDEVTPKILRRAVTSVSGESSRRVVSDPMSFQQTPFSSQGQDNEATIRASRRRRFSPTLADIEATPTNSIYLSEGQPGPAVLGLNEPASSPLSSQLRDEKPALNLDQGSTTPPLPNFFQFVNDPTNSGSIAERAWMMKMASEMARRYEEERQKGSFGSSTIHQESMHQTPPPAYS